MQFLPTVLQFSLSVLFDGTHKASFSIWMPNFAYLNSR